MTLESILDQVHSDGWWIMQISQHNWTIESGIPNWSAIAHKTPSGMYMGHARGEGNTLLKCLIDLQAKCNECVFTEIHLPNPMQLTLDDKIKPAKDLPDFMQDILANLRPKIKIERRF